MPKPKEKNIPLYAIWEKWERVSDLAYWLA